MTDELSIKMTTKRGARLELIKEELEKTLMSEEIEQELNRELLRYVEKLLLKERKTLNT